MLAYIETGNKSEAYRRAYNVGTMLPTTINNKASALTREAHIADRIQELKDQTSNAAVMDRAGVLNLITEIATADASQLSEVQVRCCRHCWGVGHRKQWKNEIEFGFACAEVIDRNAEAQDRWQRDVAIGSKAPQPEPTPLPTDAGGYGFDVTAGPNPECPVCLGDGHEVVRVKDTRKLKGAAKRLFAGAKMGKNGIEVFSRNQQHALDLLAKAHGIVKDQPAGPVVNVGVNAQGAENVTVVAVDPLEASRQYQELMRGSNS